MTAHDKQSFFTPEEFSCQKSRLTSATYNLAHILLNRNQLDHLFIPIRSMQYLAVIEQSHFWFVDSQAYAVQDNEGGRLIRISWHPIMDPSQRTGLNQPIDCRVVFYGKDMNDIQRRLIGEFYQAMSLVDRRHSQSLPTNSGINITQLKPIKK